LAEGRNGRFQERPKAVLLSEDQVVARAYLSRLLDCVIIGPNEIVIEAKALPRVRVTRRPSGSSSSRDVRVAQSPSMVHRGAFFFVVLLFERELEEAIEEIQTQPRRKPMEIRSMISPRYVTGLRTRAAWHAKPAKIAYSHANLKGW
jgi:hypothetical protein